MMRKLLPTTLALTVAAGWMLASGSLPALAGEYSGVQAEGRPVSERRGLDANGKLSVRNTAGSVQIQGWNKPEMELTGTLGDGVDKLEISGSPADLHVDVRLRKGERYSYTGTRLLLRVPEAVALSLESTSADLTVTGSSGVINARSVSGDIGLDVDSGDIATQTVSGDLRINAPKAHQLQLTTVSGDVELHGPSGSLTAESVSGDIDLHGGTFSKLNLKSVSGDLDVHADAAPDAVIKAESLSGDVRFNAMNAVNAQVSLKSFSGDKHCNAEHEAMSLADGKRTVYTLGDGRGQITLTSFSGDVVLEHK